MAKSTPLLPQSNSIEQETMRLMNQHPSPTSLDELIEQSLGGFGWAQFIQAILVSLPLLFDGQQTFISVYTDAEPTWRCINNITCNSSSNICGLSKGAWAWDGPSYKTIISEWGLECASSIISGLPASSYFIGCLIGGFVLATLGDSSLGRKKLLFLSSLAMSVFAFVTIFSTNIWVYSILRFTSGFFRSSVMTTVLVLLVEMVGKRLRGQVGIIGFFCFTLGLLSLPAIAYLNRGSSWRALYLWTSIPGIVYCMVAYFFVSESPRWLFMQGHEIEAIAVLKRLGSTSHDNLSSCLLPPKHEPSKVDLESSIKELFKRRWALRRLLAVMAFGFGVGLVYYGMLLGVGNLGFNIYLGLTFNGLLDIPAYFLTFFLIARWNRTSSMITFCIASGLCSIICVIVGDKRKGVQVGLELASFFSVCVAFNVVLIYATELFPTCVRNSAASMVRQAIIFGAVLSPLLISAGRDNEFLSYGVFGLVIICCGFCVVFLPETRGATLCDTLDEQERNDNTIMHVS